MTSFAVVAIVATATPSFAFYPVTYFRCTADQLVGHPQDANQDGRTGYGRRVWAANANNYYKLNAGNNANANRYFLPSLFNPDIVNAIDANIDLYPVYVDSTPDANLWVGPGPFNTIYPGNTFTLIAGDHVGEIGFDALVHGSPEQEVRFGDSVVPVPLGLGALSERVRQVPQPRAVPAQHPSSVIVRSTPHVTAKLAHD